MKTKKEKNAPILEQVIQRLEIEQKKEISIKKIGMFSYVVLLLAWSIYFGNLLYLSCILQEGELDLWIQSPFQIILFLTGVVVFASFVRNKITTGKKEKLLTAIKDLKGYLEDCLDIPTPSVITLAKLTGTPPPLFWDLFQTEVFLLGWKGREKLLKQVNELEERISHL